MSVGYSCARTDWKWLVRDKEDGSKFIEGVVFDDGHRILFADCNQRQVDAYLKAGHLERRRDGRLSLRPGAN